MVLTGTRPLEGTARLVPWTFKPTGATHWRCTGCGCNVSPTKHKPGSEACDRARDERDASRRD